jgi:probable phosphoglycerate mutase
MIEAQTRIIREILRLREAHPSEAIALVTHGDPIKAALAYFLGSPLDLFLRVEISPASITTISLDENQPRILKVNA